MKLGADRVTEIYGEDETRYPFVGRWNRHLASELRILRIYFLFKFSEVRIGQIQRAFNTVNRVRENDRFLRILDMVVFRQRNEQFTILRYEYLIEVFYQSASSRTIVLK